VEYTRNKGIFLIDTLQAKGKRTFTIEEAQQVLKLARPNIRILLSNLKRQKRILALTRGLYALWHPSERRWGIRPLPILDDLMKFKKTPYYIGLLSAADYYGAAHQKPQRLQVVVPRQFHMRNLADLVISIHVRMGFSDQGLEQVTTESGFVFYSSAELTALDLLYLQSASGGFGNVCMVIKELLTKLDPKKLRQIAEQYPVTASLQRLGYLLQHFQGNITLVDNLRQIIKKRKPGPVALSPAYPKKGSLDEVWRIIANADVEIEP